MKGLAMARSRTDSELHTRWLIRRDMPQVLAIESEVFDHPWSEDEFLVHLRDRQTIGMVAEIGDIIVGYMIYGLRKKALELLNFAVAAEHQRTGVGTAMVNRLTRKLNIERRTDIYTGVWERNIRAQQFFRHHGFRCTAILRGEYDESDDDCYLMRYTIKPPDRDPMPVHPVNRLSQYGAIFDTEECQ